MPPLTEIKLRSIKPGEKVQRYYDTLGMYLEVTPIGGKYWRLKYRIDGKEKRAALGVWASTTAVATGTAGAMPIRFASCAPDSDCPFNETATTT